MVGDAGREKERELGITWLIISQIEPQIFTGSGLLGFDLHSNLLGFQSFVHRGRSKDEKRAREASPGANFPLVDYN